MVLTGDGVPPANHVYSGVRSPAIPETTKDIATSRDLRRTHGSRRRGTSKGRNEG
jgi:hypothetical protein